MKISVVIPNFNGYNLLKINLPKVIAVVKESEVIIVDDSSTDESVSILNKYFPKVKVIAREKNEGFASSVNEGVENASGDLILLLNTDVLPNDDFLKYLIPHFEDPKVFAVGCLQIRNDGGVFKKEGRGVSRFETGFLVHGPGSLNKRHTLWVFGGAGMYRKEVWDKLGGMNELYNPFYWEDIDISYRALKAGFKLVFESRSVVEHQQENGAIRNFYSPEQVKEISYRNQILFVWLNINDLSMMTQHILFLPINILRAIITFDFAFLKGYLGAIFKIPKIFICRNSYKRQSFISDRKILAENKV